MKKDVKELSLGELEELFSSWGEKRFHAKQVFLWLYKRGAVDFGSMSDLPASLRLELKDNFSLGSLAVIDKRLSSDGTEKFLLGLGGGDSIEAVSIPAEGRVTGCISTQVGCKFACRFCASGIKGFKRNLSVSEMLDEALYLKDRSSVKKLTHIVFMGTGEPLDNYDNLLRVIRVLNAKEAFNIGARRITVSTSGIIPGIKKLAGEGLQVELSVSLHASDDKTRNRVMPVNKAYALKELLAACREYIKKTGRQVTFEYVLVKGLNSDLQNALELSRILKGMNCKVNLIPANPVGELGIEPPGKLEILFFRNALSKAGVNVTLRKERGADIEAACGQLRLRHEKE